MRLWWHRAAICALISTLAISAESADRTQAPAKATATSPSVQGVGWKLFPWRSKTATTAKTSAPTPPSGVVPPPAPPAEQPVDRVFVNSADEAIKIVKVSAQAETPILAQPAPIAPTTTENAVPPGPNGEVETLVANGVTLDGLISLADTHHPRLTTAFQQIQAVRGRAVQAGLYPNPVAYSASPQLAGKESQYNGFIAQDIVTAGKLKLNVSATMREVQQAEFEWQATRFAVITDIRTQFYSTLASQNRTSTWEALVKLASRSRDVAQKLLQAGEGTRGDTLLFGIEVDRAEVGLANSQTIFTIGRRQLAILTGIPDMDFEVLTGDLEAAMPEYDEPTLRYQVAQANPAANIARVEIDRQNILLQRAVVEPIPNVNIMGGYQRQVRGEHQNMGLAQISVVVPLWNRNQGNIFAAQSQVAGARADVQRIELELANQTAQALANYRASTQLVAKYEEQIVPKARETFRISEQLYAQGQIDFLRLLQAQKTLLEAELARIDAQEQRWRAASTIAGLRQDQQFP